MRSRSLVDSVDPGPPGDLERTLACLFVRPLLKNRGASKSRPGNRYAGRTRTRSGRFDALASAVSRSLVVPGLIASQVSPLAPTTPSPPSRPARQHS
mgnify:FL=1